MIKHLDVWERSHMRVANTLTASALALYFVLRYIHLSLENQAAELQMLLINTPIVAVVMLLVLLFARTMSQLAILMPACLAIGIFLTVIFQCGISYSFMAFVGVCAVCGVYFDTKAYVKFVLGLNFAIFIAKVVFGVDFTGPEISQAASYVMWGLMLLCLIVIFVSVNHASRKYRLSKRSMRSYHAMLASTPNLVALVDKENRIYHISDKLAELASVQRLDMVLGRPILDVFDNPDLIEMIAETLDAGAPYESTATVRLDDQGNHMHYKITSAPMNATMGDLSFIDISDITPIMNAKYEAESASRAKSDFLSKVSHEIRTPLNGIMGMAEIMSYENIAAKTRDQLETIKHSGNHLLSIINNLLNLSKIEHGKLEIVPRYYLLNTLIKDVVSIITMQMKETKLQMTVYVSQNIPEELCGDIVRIRQILLNLLSNAVKYTREGHVSLEVMGVITGENTIDIIFSVTDTGTGLRQDDIDKIFDEFAQFDLDRHHGIEGTGLGLAITYSLVEIMDGQIDVKSDYGEGSIFTVTLPQKFRRKGHSSGAAPYVTNRENKNVLLYGLSALYAKSITRSLDDLGVGHYIAENETELFDKLSEKNWNFVFAAPDLTSQIEDICEKIGGYIIPPRIVAVTDSHSIGKENGYLTLAMPAYALPISNILNYTQSTSTYSDTVIKNLVGFKAPEARVLVVDDISTNQEVTKGLLAIYEMQIDTCASGLEAIEAVKHTQYDLILMDHMMPEMDGIVAMEIIKSLDDKVPVVALTANIILGTMEMLLEKGFDDFLAKPIDMTKLGNVLETWIPREKQIRVEIRKNGFDDHGPEIEKTINLEIEGIDMTKGMRRVGGSLQAYLGILNVFGKDGIQKIEEIKSCTAAGNLKLYTIYVHALKVALANIGADALSKQAQALENAGNNEDMAYISDSGNEFIQNLEILLSNITVFLMGHESKAATGGSGRPMSQKDIARELANLKTALLNFDLAEIDKASAALRSAANTKLDGILNKVLVGEYDSAIEDIDKMLS